MCVNQLSYISYNCFPKKEGEWINRGWKLFKIFTLFTILCTSQAHFNDDDRPAGKYVLYYIFSANYMLRALALQTSRKQRIKNCLVSIKYIHTLLSFNFIIIVTFSDCISDQLNVQIQKLWTKPIASFSFVSCASWSWCYFGAAFYLCFKTLCGEVD